MDLRIINGYGSRNSGSPVNPLRRLFQACFVVCLGLSVSTMLRGQEPAQYQNQQIEQPAETQPSSSQMASVHGVVHNAAGEPLPRALVRIDGDATSGALTDGDGHFEIPGVPVGPQEIEVIKPGFLDESAEVAAAGMWESSQYAHNVMVAAEMPDVGFTMFPTNALHGLVQLSTGDPAQGIGVVLLRQAVQNGRIVWEAVSKAKTNTEGAYRFGGLADGLYAIYNDPAMDSEPASNPMEAGSAANVTRSGFPSHFYPESRDLAGAAKIRLSGGEQAEANLALTLEPFQSVTATVLLPGGKPGREGALNWSGKNFSAQVMDAQGHQLPFGAQYDDATQKVQALLPDGSYTLVLSVVSRGGLESGGIGSGSSMGRNAFAGSVDFTVNGHAVTKLRIPLVSVADNLIQVNLVGSAASGVQAVTDDRARGVMISISQTGGWIGDGMMSNYAEGSLSGPLQSQFTPPGAYWAHTSIADRRFCEGSLTAGGANLGREPLALGLTGSSAPLSLTLRDDCASLTITLPAEQTVPIAGKEPFYTVYAVPDFDSTTDVVPLTLRPSTGGKVTLTGLTPGSYHVYSFDKPVVLAYRDAATLEALPHAGQAVTLSPGDQGNLVLEVPEH
ncbi:MAG: carboxypeptidase-like regulatory domain-containing protein [Terracidiphilus sp.]